ANLATDAIASAQAEPADLALADVNVIRSWQEALSTKETEAIFNDLEDAITKDVALLFGLGLQELGNQVWSAHAHVTGYLQLAGEVEEIGIFLGIQIGNGKSIWIGFAIA